jgi:hypothetical protein
MIILVSPVFLLPFYDFLYILCERSMQLKVALLKGTCCLSMVLNHIKDAVMGVMQAMCYTGMLSRMLYA